MITVIVYHKTIPNLKNQEKIDVLKNFSTGVVAAGDSAMDCDTHIYRPSTVGVIQGWVHEGSKNGPHLKLRNEVVYNQLAQKKYVVIVDSNLFLYSNTLNPKHYLRYSFNGIFPNTGIYCDTDPDTARWQKISRDLNISLKDYRTTGRHILLCLQRNGGWSMGGLDVQKWTNETIATLRKYTDRPIVIRAHPGDKSSNHYLDKNNPLCKIPYNNGVQLSKNVNLVDDLKNCWAAVNYNSSPTVGAVIEGIPIFATDPDRSQCKEVCNTDLSQIENPKMFDRQSWVERLSMFHWNFSELKSGECWTHMRKFVK